MPTKKNVDTGDTMFDDVSKTNKQDSLAIDARKLIEPGHAIGKKWSDRREHQTATETILNLVVPMVMDSWTVSTPAMVIDPDSGNAVQVKIIGKRLGAKLKIDLSIFISKKQLKLLLDES